MTKTIVPFFRPELGDQEISEVVDTLRSGWLTSGKRVQLFERRFAENVGAPHAVALNSCTAALHLAVEALGLKAGQAVLVPTMTFAATAEVIRYLGATPVLVDCDPITLNMDLADAARKLSADFADSTDKQPPQPLEVVGIMPVHVGGLMMDLKALRTFAAAHKLWIVEDAAHAFPAALRQQANDAWQRCGQMEEGERRVVCFSFYANKTITTGEGGMAVTGDAELARRMRTMSLHGLTHDAWGRYSGNGNWDYKIIAPGYKYNLTDIAAAIGIHQLARAEEMRREREGVARFYLEALADVDEIELPPEDPNCIHAWHLFPIRLRLEKLSIGRNQFIVELKRAGVGCSVHWRPLHLHPYYQETFGYRPEDFPVATSLWQRLISLPIFPGMRREEIGHVVGTVREICGRHSFRGDAGTRGHGDAEVRDTGTHILDLKPSPIVYSFEPLKSAESVDAMKSVDAKGFPRSFDVVVSLVGLVLSAPLLLVSAVAVMITSPGGFLFRQKRVGRYGELFVLYKLRTMRASNIGPQVTKRGDRRITRVGKFLRKTKLDELPTLWNVLRGDMALVGPRPEVPGYVRQEDPLWQAVLAARPGITDPVTLRLRNEEKLLAQVEGDTEKFYLNELQPAKLKGYIAYLERRNWLTDLSVLWRTLAAVLVPHEDPRLDENGGSSFQIHRE